MRSRHNTVHIAFGVAVVLLLVGTVAFMVYDSTDPWTLEQSVEGSEQVADARLSAQQDSIALTMTMEPDARMNDPYCVTTSTGDTTTTTCYDDWNRVQVSSISVIKQGDGWLGGGDEQIDTARVKNGETGTVYLPWEKGEYTVLITAENGWVTSMTIHIKTDGDSFEVAGTNWSNEV